MRDGTAATSSSERRALLALSGNERALHALTRPILWEVSGPVHEGIGLADSIPRQTPKLDARSPEPIEAFAEVVSAQRARLIRTVDYRRKKGKDEEVLKKVANACAQVLKRTPKVDELRLAGSGSA